jgi:hypothetical protein
MLEKAVAAVKRDKAKALDLFNKDEGRFKDRGLYLFFANASDGIMTAHPYGYNRVQAQTSKLRRPPITRGSAMRFVGSAVTRTDPYRSPPSPRERRGRLSNF